MITNEQVLKAASESTHFPEYSEYAGNWEFTPEELTRFAHKMYAAGLLAGAEKCDVEASSYGEGGWIQASINCAEALREMAKEIE